MSMKEAYEQKLQAQLDEWRAEIDKLKAKADNAEADAQVEYYKQIEELHSMQESATNKLDELKDAQHMMAKVFGSSTDHFLLLSGNNPYSH